MAKMNDMIFLFLSIVGFLTIVYYLFSIMMGDTDVEVNDSTHEGFTWLPVWRRPRQRRW